MSHRRYNPLLDQWIIVSPNRISRPWTGANESTSSRQRSSTQKAVNPLAPGALRSNGDKNPDYTSTFIFPNDFPALSSVTEGGPNPPPRGQDEAQDLMDDPFFRQRTANGSCHVMCYHPNSNLTLPLMSPDSVVAVIERWAEATAEFAKNPSNLWVQIFENHGVATGCSNPHPHCQIWCSEFLPTIVQKMDGNLKAYHKRHGGKESLLRRYCERENGEKSPRHVCSNADWVVFVPWWAQWPFETLLLPRKRDVRRLDDLTKEEIVSLAALMQELLTRYDNLFKTDFPFCFTWYQCPLQDTNEHWLLHATWFPPLLRSAEVKKFVAGYELFAELQRDLTPEKAAELLRDQSLTHFTSQCNIDAK